MSTVAPWTGCTLPQTTTDREAAARHLAFYAELKRQGHGKPGPYGKSWTCEDALALGRTYVAAHGHVPTPTHMRTDYGLPNISSLTRLFGSVLAFQQALSSP